MTRYRVEYERDESGAWIARVPRVRGCHTHGRTLEQARARIREALELWAPGAGSAELVDDVRLPKRASQRVASATAARRRAEAERDVARAHTAAAARMLVKDVGISLRDAGELLGLTRQRVQQLLRTP